MASVADGVGEGESMSTPAMEQVAIPAHVPRDLVRDLDLYALPGLESGHTLDVHALWKNVQDTHPPVFWTPHYGGHWVVTRYAEIEKLLFEHERFSSSEPFVPRGVIPLQIPVQFDPPQHGPFRKLLMPAFAPKVLARATERARAAAVEIIERLRPEGSCEFVQDFAGTMPVIAFLTLIDLPEEDYAYLRGVAVRMSSPADPAAPAAWAEMSAYVQGHIDERRKAPRDDFITSLLTAKVGGRPLTSEEIFGMCLLIVGGGLDTVVSMTSFAAAHLAQHPEARADLLAHPDRMASAVEEIARRFGTSNLGRQVRQDTTLGGVDIPEGDIVMALIPLAGLDETVTDDPMALDFSRGRPRHLAFGIGPHTCIGNTLARREIRIFLEEWLSRIPDFRLAAGTMPHVTTGIVNSVADLHLEWDVA